MGIKNNFFANQLSQAQMRQIWGGCCQEPPPPNTQPTDDKKNTSG